MSEHPEIIIASGKNFEYWASLAQTDPTQFEIERKAAIKEVLDNAPAHMQERLKALQMRVDLERSLATSPMDACVRLSKMMIGYGAVIPSFSELTGVLKGLLSNTEAFQKEFHSLCNQLESLVRSDSVPKTS